MPKKSGRALERVSLKVEQELKEGLETLELGGCRNTREVINYLLEVVSAVYAETAFRIRPESKSPFGLAGYLSLHLPADLHNRLVQQAKAFGVGLPEITRSFLWMGLTHHKKFVPKGTMVKKEVFSRLIRRELEKQSRLDDIRQGFRLIWQAFFGR